MSVVEGLLDLGPEPGIVVGAGFGGLVRWRDKYGDGGELTFNDDFGAGANMGKQRREVADGLSFRDVDDCHREDDTADGEGMPALL